MNVAHEHAVSMILIVHFCFKSEVVEVSPAVAVIQSGEFVAFLLRFGSINLYN